MKLRLTQKSVLKAAAVTAFASVFMIGCNSNGKYDKAVNNNQDNQKALVQAQQAEDAANAAGLADSSWVCNNDLSVKASGQPCLSQEQIYISKDLQTLTKFMEIDEQQSANNEPQTIQCAYTVDSTLKLANKSSATDISGRLFMGSHVVIQNTANSDQAACQNAFENEQQEAQAQAAQNENQKHHKHNGHSSALQTKSLDIELSLSDNNGSNNELTVVITKIDSKTQAKKTYTNIYTREPELSLITTNPPVNFPENEPKVVLGSQSASPASSSNSSGSPANSQGSAH